MHSQLNCTFVLDLLVVESGNSDHTFVVCDYLSIMIHGSNILQLITDLRGEYGKFPVNLVRLEVSLECLCVPLCVLPLACHQSEMRWGWWKEASSYKIPPAALPLKLTNSHYSSPRNVYWSICFVHILGIDKAGIWLSGRSSDP
jgi:hypothetical protein